MPKIGQYVPGDSFIHNLDPRTKIISAFFSMVLIFFISNFVSYALLYAAVFFVIYKTGLSAKVFLSPLKGLISILFITVLFNLFWSKGGEVIWSFWIFKITDQSLIYSIKMFLRLVILVVSSSIMTMTTQPMDLTAGLEAIFSPLKKFKVPVGEFATMISISLRFVPTLQEEAERIYKAQVSRGANFDTGNLIERAKKLLPILVPLFTGALGRADELACAMESRCYEPGAERTKRSPLRYGKKDIIFMIFAGVFFAMLIIGERFL